MIYYFCALYEAQNADKARMLEIWFDDKVRKVYATCDF